MYSITNSFNLFFDSNRFLIPIEQTKLKKLYNNIIIYEK